MSRQLGWVGVCLAVLGAGCDIKVGDNGVSVDFAVGRATDEWTRTYELQPGGQLEIVNVNGAIRVSPSTGPQVDVRASREIRAGSEEEAQEILRKTEMREEVSTDRVRIETPTANEGGRGINRPQLRVTFDVQVPAGLTLVLKTQNGEVRLEDVEGRVTASTTNGGVNGTRVSGSMEASTVNGGIRMELRSVSGDTRLVTVNGGVSLFVAPDLAADLDANVVNGGISIDDGLAFAAEEQSRRRVAGQLNAGGSRIVVQTTNGGVRVASRREVGP